MAVWDVSTAVYEDKYKDVSTQDSIPRGVFFKPDGTKMYMVGGSGRKVYQYTLSTPWDVETAAYETKYKYVGDLDYPRTAFFKPDGSKMYIMGYENDTVWQYSLSTEWDVSTATYEDKFKNIGDEETYCEHVTFKTDGSKMYIVGWYQDTVFQYSLSTPWDVSSATYEDKFKDIGDEEGEAYSVFFKTDGTKMYIVGQANDTVFQYSLSTGWDVSSAVYENKYKYIGDEEDRPSDIFFKPDGREMYILGWGMEKVHQYRLPGAVFYQSLSGSFGFTGSVIKLTKKMLTGSLTFLGSIFLGRFLQATLSISCNESELSVYSNESALSIYENESILSIEE